MNYENFTLEELVLDDAFRAWALQPDADSAPFWEAFLRTYPAKRDLVHEAARLVRLLRVKEVPINEAEIRWALLRMRQVIDRPAAQAIPRRGRLRRLMAARSFRVAAALSLLLGTWAWAYLGYWQPVRYDTAYGELRRVELPDGSVVTLNANSELRSFRWKPGKPREVYLDGEAFFEITHQPDHARFIVHTPDVSVEVLGTTFNVSRRHERTRVVLNSGRVRLYLEKQPAAKPIVLQPGDLVDVSAEQSRVVRRVVRPFDYSAWQQHKLVFDNTPIAEVAQLLEDTYGLTVRFDDPTLAQRRLSGTVPSRNRQVLLNAIATLLDGRMEEQEGGVVFK